MIAIDPGLRGCGVAIFAETTLLHALYLKSPETKATGVKAWIAMAEEIRDLKIGFGGPLLIEQQRLRLGNEKGNPQNMMELQGVVGVISGMLYQIGLDVVGYYPEQWKGTVKKLVMLDRILKRLSPEELKIALDIEIAPSLRHNVIDAIGIGLFHLGRLKHDYSTPRS